MNLIINTRGNLLHKVRFYGWVCSQRLGLNQSIFSKALSYVVWCVFFELNWFLTVPYRVQMVSEKMGGLGDNRNDSRRST
jgi:hypothetical protein